MVKIKGENNVIDLLTQVEREACKGRLFEFVKSFWSVIIPETPVFNWHIEFLCEELQKLAPYIVGRLPKPYDLIINIPPGTTKSTIVTIMFPAWIWTQDPTIRSITNSYAADIAIEHATKSRDIITSDKYKRLFPEVAIRRDKSGKTNYENTKTGARYTASTGGAVTGKHAHLIINDDPVNPKQAESEDQRKTANEHTKTLSSRKVDKKNTITITIMQRLHKDDVTGYLLKKKGEKIRHICLPAEANKGVKPLELQERYIDGLLDPIRLDREVLEEQKVDLGSRAYSGQYDQNPVAAGGNYVKKEWFNIITRAEFERLRQYEPINFWLDTAYTEKTENDPTGIVGACKILNDIYIVNAKKVRLEFPELIRFLPKYVVDNGYTSESILRIEPKASGISIIQELKDKTDLNVTETPTPDDSKTVRITAASPTIESRRVFVVDDFFREEFIDEICGFPSEPHDEYVDLIGYIIDYYKNAENAPQENLSDYFN